MADRLGKFDHTKFKMNSEVNKRRIENVEQCFGKQGKPLAQLNRVLVGEGVLVKMCRKKAKQRQFFLFNDVLVYGNIVIAKKRYNKQHRIDLRTVELEDLPDEGGVKNGWIIRSEKKSFAVYAASSTEKLEWMKHIERCVADLEKGDENTTKEHAPVWVPDVEAARCMVCGRTQFNFVQRRHHCRKCGKVVCGACSTHSYKIDTQNKKPVRVCDLCFRELTTNKDGFSTIPSTCASQIIKENSDTSSDSDDENGKDDSRPTFYREENSS